MIHDNLNADQARRWATLLGQQASSRLLPDNPMAQPSGPVFPRAFTRPQPTWLDQLLQRIRARQETRKNLHAQEFMMGV